MQELLHLPKQKRDKILQSLTESQQNYLKSFLKRGKKTVFANILAREKASNEKGKTNIVEKWELVDFIDEGPNWRKISTSYCQCGRKLRYQYIVKNLTNNKIKKFGIDHFEEHTNIPASLANRIKAGFESIDYELDEILLKISYNWRLEDEGIEEIPSQVEVAKDIEKHLNLNLPLLNRQVQRLREAISKINEKKEEEFFSRKYESPVVKKEKSEIVGEKMNFLPIKENLKETELWKEVRGGNDLEESLQLSVIIELLNLSNEYFLASYITEKLVTIHGAEGSRFPSGRLRIFPNVCLFLEHLVEKNKLKFIKIKARKDRLYQIVNLEL